MAEEDRIEVVKTAVALQLAKGTIAHVEKQPEAVGLYEQADSADGNDPEQPTTVSFIRAGTSALAGSAESRCGVQVLGCRYGNGGRAVRRA
jgi:hypothetical protein